AWTDLTPGYDTFARRFAQHAYHTVCSGKLHHLGADQMQGWTRRLAPDAMVFDKYTPGLIAERYRQYTATILTDRKTNEFYVKEARADFGTHQRFDQRAIEDAEDFVRTHFAGPADRRRPVMLKLSLLQPHHPFFTSAELLDYYCDRVKVFVDEPCNHPVLSLSQIEHPVSVSEEEIRRATATYYGMTETIDTYYGQLMDALTAAGENLDEWIIVYLSDHGEMLGEHGIWEKARFYEGSVRVPLVVRWPKRLPGGTVVDQNVNLCDLYATLCDLAGVPCPPGLDSRSLVGLMDGDAAGWSNETVSQIRRHHRNHVMIKQDDLKYQYYGEDIPEVLFDLAADGGETSNLAADGRYAPAMASFRTRLAELGYGPDADPNYVNAGYECGVETSPGGTETLWPADSNPWMDPLPEPTQ
ncbi:MAG: sulfatase family protein, partial [Planctomycetota bacterium]